MEFSELKTRILEHLLKTCATDKTLRRLFGLWVPEALDDLMASELIRIVRRNRTTTTYGLTAEGRANVDPDQP